MNLFHNSELQSKKIAKLLTMIMQDIMRYKPGIRRKVRIVRVVDKKRNYDNVNRFAKKKKSDFEMYIS